MRVDVIDSVKAMAQVRADWDAVYGADPDAHVFLSWTWMARWLPHIGTPWFVLAARPDADAPYVAFLPLWLQTTEQKSGGFQNNLVMGGSFISDYTGILCLPEHQEQAIPAFADQIKTLHWTSLRLEDLCMSRRRTDLFTQAFSRSGFGVATLNRVEDGIDQGICPIAHLPGDWDSYLEEKLSANMRQKVRRLLRQVEESAELRITQADAKTIDRDLDTLLRFWEARWGVRKGERLKDILRNLRAMLRHAFDAGMLFLPVLWQGDRPVCALGTLIDARKKSFLFFLAGRDQTFDGPSSGLVLHAHSIRHAIRNGFVVYDFLRGNESYKYSFGVEERRIESLVLSTKDRKNLGGHLDRRCLPYVLQVSMEHHRAGRHEAAEIGYRQVVQADPNNADALYGLGQFAAKRGEHGAAIALFRTLLAVAPATHKAWFRLGRSLRGSGEFWEAVRAYCEGIERGGALPGAYYDLGHLLLQLGQVDLAVAAFEAARGLQPGFADLDASLTRARRRLGGLSPEERARQASGPAELCDRIGRLAGIAAILEHGPRSSRPAFAAAREHSGARSP